MNELYQQMILHHSRYPYGFGEIEDKKGCHIVDAYNPLCGDRYSIYIHKDREKVIEIKFKGEGCAISKASASLMAQEVKGMTFCKVKGLIQSFRCLIKGEEGKMIKEMPQTLQSFSGVSRYPARVKCAILAWHALLGGIEDKKEVTTE